MPEPAAASSGSPRTTSPLELVEQYETGLDAGRRRRDGVHYTPAPVADAVLDLALTVAPEPPASVCDPSCGAGAFLLRVADRLAAEGQHPERIVTRQLVGLELDPDAAALARRALADWAAQHGAAVAPERVRVHVADALSVPPDRWPDRPAGGFDLVIGNPPFRSQLAARTARDRFRREQLRARFGQVGAYTDDAGLFLVLATELVAPGGVVAMVQPWSFLSARDAAEVRDRVLADADLVGLWAHTGTPFADASVQVCAPVLRRHRSRGGTGAAAAGCEVRWQGGHDDPGRLHVPPPGPGVSWGALLAGPSGVPELPPLTGPALGGVATATAGFRDEFYALCAAAHETAGAEPGAVDAGAGDVGAAEPLPDTRLGPRLVSVGMVDPLRLRWGTATFRLGGRRLVAPRLDTRQLAEAAPRVARWAAARCVPKVLVATQTKVVEVVADPDGWTVPLTPTISVEPCAGGPDVWHLAAALSAPPVAALALRSHLGAARAADALRWSARSVLEVPLPTDAERWAHGADLARRVQLAEPAAASLEPDLEQLAATMTAAYGLSPQHPVVEWWWARRPRR